MAKSVADRVEALGWQGATKAHTARLSLSRDALYLGD